MSKRRRSMSQQNNLLGRVKDGLQALPVSKALKQGAHIIKGLFEGRVFPDVLLDMTLKLIFVALTTRLVGLGQIEDELSPRDARPSAKDMSISAVLRSSRFLVVRLLLALIDDLLEAVDEAISALLRELFLGIVLRQRV